METSKTFNYQAYTKVRNIQTLLRVTFGIIPILAGLDKFTNILTVWENYLSPLVLSIVPLDAVSFMHIVGIIEVFAGIVVLAAPRTGGYLVMAWLLGIVVNLITTGQFFDIAVRDLGLAIGAYSLAGLTEALQPSKRDSDNDSMNSYRKREERVKERTELFEPNETITADPV